MNSCKWKAWEKAPGTQAGEFVREEFVHEEIEHIREGNDGARSTKQAIAIGLSKARRAGVELPPAETASRETREQAKRDPRSAKCDLRKAGKKTKFAKHSRATLKALQKEPRSVVPKKALAKQAR